MPKTTKHLKPHQFKPGQSGNPEGGRKHNPIARVLKEITLETYRELIKVVLAGNLDHLRKIIKDPQSSALMVGIARSYVKAADAGDWETIEKITQRIVGKIPEEIIVSSTNKNLNANVNTEVDNVKMKAALALLDGKV
jgi:Family of unknown function (DUF5681)